MAIAIGRRRFHGNRYFGDGAYPHQPPVIVLTDTATGQMNRLTAPGGIVTLVPISVLAATDVKTDVCVLRDTGSSLQYWYLKLTNGVLKITATLENSRPIMYMDAATLREFVVSAGVVTTVTRPDITV